MSGEVAQQCVPARVAALERPLQLDVEALRPEGLRKRGGGVRVTHAEALPRAAGEAHEPLVQLREQAGSSAGGSRSPLLRPRVGACAAVSSRQRFE